MNREHITAGVCNNKYTGIFSMVHMSYTITLKFYISNYARVRHVKMAIYGQQYTRYFSKQGSLWSTMHSSRSPRQQFMVNNALFTLTKTAVHGQQCTHIWKWIQLRHLVTPPKFVMLHGGGTKWTNKNYCGSRRHLLAILSLAHSWGALCLALCIAHCQITLLNDNHTNT